MAAAHPFGAFVGCRFKRIGCVRRIKVEVALDCERRQRMFENKSAEEDMWVKYG